MRLENALQEIVCGALNHVINMVEVPDRCYWPVIDLEILIRYIYETDIPQRDTGIPVTRTDIDEWAKRIAFSLIVEKAVLAPGSTDADIVNVFKMIIPQMAQDLWIDAEILEARFEVV